MMLKLVVYSSVWLFGCASVLASSVVGGNGKQVVDDSGDADVVPQDSQAWRDLQADIDGAKGNQESKRHHFCAVCGKVSNQKGDVVAHATRSANQLSHANFNKVTDAIFLDKISTYYLHIQKLKPEDLHVDARLFLNQLDNVNQEQLVEPQLDNDVNQEQLDEPQSDNANLQQLDEPQSVQKLQKKKKEKKRKRYIEMPAPDRRSKRKQKFTQKAPSEYPCFSRSMFNLL